MKMRVLWTAVILLSLIAVAAVVRRTVAFYSQGAPGGIDSEFSAHKALTMFHMIPGLVFILVGPFQFSRKLRARRPRLHRIAGRVYLCAGLVTGVSAIMMSPQIAIGGANETAATLLFACVFLFALAAGFRDALRRRFVPHRQWMIRAYAIGLAIATIRPIVGAFFATRSITHLTPHDFFGIAFWIGFTLHLIAAEVWISSTGPTGVSVEANARRPAAPRP